MIKRMDFSEALAKAKEGSKISRAGWNAPGQWVVAQRGYPEGIGINEQTAKATGMPPGTVAVFGPYMQLRAADGTFWTWVPTQSDLFAQDWRELP